VYSSSKLWLPRVLCAGVCYWICFGIVFMTCGFLADSLCAIICVLTVLVCYSFGAGIGLGHPHTFSTVSYRLVWEGRARPIMGFRVVVVASGV
jgi:uncharacterized membrane protein